MIDVFRPIDALPRLCSLRSSEFGAGIERRIACLFPALSAARRQTILRRFLRYRLLNRVIYRATIRAPKTAELVARFVPVTGIARLRKVRARRDPVIIATGHCGSLYFMIFVVARLMGRRNLYVMHKKSISDAPRNEAFLRRRGIVPIADDERGLRELLRAVRTDPSAAVLLAFDPRMETGHMVPFLATYLPAFTGIGLLADVGRCAVIPLFWRYRGGIPWIEISEPIFADTGLPAGPRRIEVVESLYRLLETFVAASPDQWQLDFVHENIAAPRASIAVETSL